MLLFHFRQVMKSIFIGTRPVKWTANLTDYCWSIKIALESEFFTQEAAAQYTSQLMSSVVNTSIDQFGEFIFIISLNVYHLSLCNVTLQTVRECSLEYTELHTKVHFMRE